MNSVVIDCFPESVSRYRTGYAVVAVDVIRATTTAISAVAAGRRCFMASTIEGARELAARLGNALLVGEQKGAMPPDFDLNNSPAALLARTDVDRPAVLLSSSGTRLCQQASLCEAAFLACFRNHLLLPAHLAGAYSRIAVIGAGSRGEFRPEDQMCCAQLAKALVELGYSPATSDTADIIRRWGTAPANAWLHSKSVQYLRDSGQIEDLQFILDHTGDLGAVFAMQGNEVTVNPVVPVSGDQFDIGLGRPASALCRAHRAIPC